MVGSFPTVPVTPYRPNFSAAKYRKALEHAYSDMEWLRTATGTASKEYQGRRRSRVGKIGVYRPFNPLNQVVSTYLPNLSAYKVIPRCGSKGAASAAEGEFRDYLTAVNLEAMCFPETDRAIGLDAILSSFGGGKLNRSIGAGQFKDSDRATDFGEIGFNRVAPEDWLFDPNATSIRSCAWIADRYTANKNRLVSLLEEAGLQDKADIVKGLRSLTELDDSIEERGLGGKPDSDTNVEDEIVLWDVVIFDRDDVYVGTLAHWNDSDTQDWIVEPEIYQGGERGPYVHVSLMDVANQPIGMGIADQMMELHFALQGIGEKVYKQIVETKRVNGYKANKRRDADAMRKAKDGEWVALGDPDFFREAIMGGMLAEMVPGVELLMGALDIAAATQQGSGRGRNEGTATKAAIQNQRVSVTFSDMAERMMEMRRKVIRRINFWIDEQPELEQARSVPGPFGPIELLYSRETRRSRYTDFDYDCDVVTADNLDPNMRLARMNGAMDAAARFLPIVAQTGGDLAETIDAIAREFKWDGLRRIYPTRSAAELRQRILQTTRPSTPEGTKPSMSGDKASPRFIDQVRSDMAPATPSGPALLPGAV